MLSSEEPAPQFEVALLGSLELRVKGASVTVRAAQQRPVLAALALAAPRPVLPERLIDLLWPEGAPASARTALHNNIRRLRANLSGLGCGDMIKTGPEGYLLVVAPDDVDVGQFVALVRIARGLADRGDLIVAGETYEQALNLWRGEPFPDLVGAGLLAAEAERLVELRISAIEAWATLDLGVAQGRTAAGAPAAARRDLAAP